MKIQGEEVDIKKVDDDFLTSRQGAIQGTLKVAYIVLGIFAAGCLIFALAQGIEYGLKTGLEMLLMMLAFVLMIGLIFILPMITLWKEQKEIKTEIARRVKAQKGNTDIEDALKRKSKRSMIVVVCIIAVAVVIACSALLPTLGSSHSKKSQSDRCRNCGRKTELVAGFGFCYTCYEGFTDWQEDYFDKED